MCHNAISQFLDKSAIVFFDAVDVNMLVPMQKFHSLLLIPAHQRSITHQIADLGFDSLDFADIVMQMEKAFDISIPYDIAEERCKLVAVLSEIIWELLSKKEKEAKDG